MARSTPTTAGKPYSRASDRAVGHQATYLGHEAGDRDEQRRPARASDINYFVATDSGGVVLVRAIPAGVISRSFAGNLGFPPLFEGLDELGRAYPSLFARQGRIRHRVLTEVIPYPYSRM